jgi:hypothetical protein
VLDQRCEELARAARAQDAVAFQASTQLVWQAAQGAPPGELNRALQKVCHLFNTVNGIPMALAGRLAVLGGALVEEGADPAPLVGVAVAGLDASADACVEFAAAWQRIVGADRPLPAPVDSQAAFDATVAALTGHTGTWRLPRRRGLSRADAYELAADWFSSALWTLAATTLLQIPGVRRDLPLRDQVTEAVAAVAQLRPDFGRLAELLALSDEQ